MGRHQSFELLPASHMCKLSHRNTSFNGGAMLPSMDGSLCFCVCVCVCVCVCTCWCSSGPDRWAAVAPASPGPADLCLREKDSERHTQINHCFVWRGNIVWMLAVRSWLIDLFFLPDWLIDCCVFLTLPPLCYSIVCVSLQIHFGYFHKQRIITPAPSLSVIYYQCHSQDYLIIAGVWMWQRRNLSESERATRTPVINVHSVLLETHTCFFSSWLAKSVTLQ